MNNAQSKLEAMKAWTPERLAAATRRLLTPVPKPFTPDLRMHVPQLSGTRLTNEGHRAWVFEHSFRYEKRPAIVLNDDGGTDSETLAAYIAAWDRANGLLAA